MKTPSSKDYLIITAAQIYERARKEALEFDVAMPFAIEGQVGDIFCENGYVAGEAAKQITDKMLKYFNRFMFHPEPDDGDPVTYFKKKQVKFYIPRKDLKEIKLGVFQKAAKYIFNHNNNEGYYGMFSCIALSQQYPSEEEMRHYAIMFETCGCTFNNHFRGYGEVANGEEVLETRLLALCLAQAAWNAGDRFE